MKNDETRGRTHRSARVPATLLIIMVTAIAGAVLWLALTPPPQEPETPAARVQLVPAEGTTPPPGPPPPQAAEPQGDPSPSTGSPTPESKPPDATAEPQPAPPGNQAGRTSDTPDAAPSDAQPQTNGPGAPPPAPPDDRPSGQPSAPPAPQAQSAEETQRNAMVAPPMPPMMPKLPPAPPSPPLSKAPDPALVEETPKGPLPVVGRDGREAWRVYARPFNQDDRRPRLAVVLYGLGNSAAATRTAIQGLPGAITLAFTPYADDLPSWIADARAAGHEVLLMVPMEPVNYPDFDPGPQALLTSLDSKVNIDRLEWMLGRGVGYVGVTDFMGSRFTSSATHMRVFLENLKKRGLMFLESRAGARAVAGEIASITRVPFAANTLYIDAQASRPAIDGQLREAERLAHKLKEVVIMGFLYPVTLERVALWAKSIEERGLVLAPVSALARRKEP